MKRKMVTALLCSMVIATSAAGSAAAVSADTEAVMTEAVEMHRGFGGQAIALPEGMLEKIALFARKNGNIFIL